MRFEPASQPTPTGGADVSVRQTTRFTLEQPPFAGQSFAVAFRVCANPCCPCEVVTVECRPETAPESVVPFCVEVFDRRLARRVQTSPEGIALGKAFVAEAQDSEWEWLEGLFLGAKLEAIEGVDDVDQLEVDLPPEVKEGEGTMVAYTEIFPWADRFAFTLEGETWVVDEQYCMAPGCTCTEIGMGFFRVPARRHRMRGSVQTSAFLFHDYRTGGFRVVERQAGTPPPEQLMHALQEAYPRLAETLRHRRAQMQKLGRRLMPEARPRSRGWLSGFSGESQEVAECSPAEPAAAKLTTPKVGRNDPCPCGSGKKYKKCCGAA